MWSWESLFPTRSFSRLIWELRTYCLFQSSSFSLAEIQSPQCRRSLSTSASVLTVKYSTGDSPLTISCRFKRCSPQSVCFVLVLPPQCGNDLEFSTILSRPRVKRLRQVPASNGRPERHAMVDSLDYASRNSELASLYLL